MNYGQRPSKCEAFYKDLDLDPLRLEPRRPYMEAHSILFFGGFRCLGLGSSNQDATNHRVGYLKKGMV